MFLGGLEEGKTSHGNGPGRPLTPTPRPVAVLGPLPLRVLPYQEGLRLQRVPECVVVHGELPVLVVPGVPLKWTFRQSSASRVWGDGFLPREGGSVPLPSILPLVLTLSLNSSGTPSSLEPRPSSPFPVSLVCDSSRPVSLRSLTPFNKRIARPGYSLCLV